MVDFQSIDDRTNLAGTNRLELLMFKLDNDLDVDRTALYGINVFKVRELMVVPRLVRLPGSHPCMAGMASIRGQAVPVIDLNRYCGFSSKSEPTILVVTEFNSSTQGFLVSEVEDIIQLAWSEIQEPPEILSREHGNILTAVSLLDERRMLLIIDVERAIAETLGSVVDIDGESIDSGAGDGGSDDDDRIVFFADDSAVARAQVGKILDRMQLRHQSGKNGQDAYDQLRQLADEAEEAGRPLKDSLLAIVTDIEMPNMDGYVLTGKIKADKRFEGIPVMMHSSLSATENKRLGLEVGADAYMPKLKPKEFSATLAGLITDTHPDIAASASEFARRLVEAAGAGQPPAA